LFASVGGWFLASRALRPIDYITKTARAISNGDLNQRLRMPRTEDEVGRLAVTFDEMLNKLENSINKERQFASDASHELRTPIAIISAQAEEALSGAHNTKEYKEALSTVQKESKKMSHIISQLLMMYRSNEGRYKFNFEVIDLKLIAGEIVKEFKNIASENGIKISFNAEEEIKIRLDQTLITRLIINLIDNAIRYNKKGGRVSVSINRENDFAKIIVEDNGIGMSEEVIPYIFNRFYQVEKSRGNIGTGLGLSIVKWIVDLHKGEINVESKVNQGSKFVIKLPLNL
jgi:signal transduction histidine kinase